MKLRSGGHLSPSDIYVAVLKLPIRIFVPCRKSFAHV